MGASSFQQQANALLRQRGIVQRRSALNNACILVGPIFFCVLLAVLQAVVNNLLAQQDTLQCGCQCLQCCTTDGNCTRLEAGYCDSSRGLTCALTDPETCGPQYSTPTQAVFCEIPRPSIWPPVTRVPRPNFFARPYGPYQAIPLMYTADPEGTGDVITTTPDTADAIASQMYIAPKLQLAQLPSLQSLFSGLISNNRTVFNGQLLSLLGFTFANAASVPSNYYLDSAFINSGTNFEIDTLYVLLPNNTCITRGLALNRSSSSTLDFVSFFIKYFSYDLPGIEGLIKGAGIDLATLRQQVAGITKVGCVDVPSWRLPSAEAIDATLYCGFNNGYAWGPAQCNKTRQQTSRRIDSYFTAVNTLDTKPRSGLDAVITYNLSLPVRASQSNYRLPGLVSSLVGGWARSQMPPSVAQSIPLLGVQSMPKAATSLTIDFSSMLGPLFFTWVLQLLLPTMLQQLVYEKERRLRMMMKMHGLGDSVYWLVCYVWYLLLHLVYILIFTILGGLIGLEFFRRNSYSMQALLYFLFIQTQLGFTFFLSSFFSAPRTAVVCGYLYVLTTGLLGYLLLDPLMGQDKPWMWVVELVPAFALYRGLFELGEYSSLGVYRSGPGITWPSLHDQGNGMGVVWVILAVEWGVFMVLAWYLEQVIPTGNGIHRHPLFFIRWVWHRDAKKGHTSHTPAAPHLTLELPALSGSSTGAASEVQPNTSSGQVPADIEAHVVGVKDPLAEPLGLGVSGGKVTDHRTIHLEPAMMGGEDVLAESLRAEEAARGGADAPILAVHLNRTFSALAGGSSRVAVQDLSLVVRRGECFGLLGPNGAGKTTAINMLTGFIEPTSGTGIVEGLDIRSDMPLIYKLMGVCPQHDLLWEQLSGREHLRFYGRLKGLEGQALETAVDDALKAVKLFLGGQGDKLAGTYSGGMKRRLSVAISFIGSPRVVYLDEPSTGLDPASRRNLWDMVKGSKEGRAIILTTHSMQEAEILCDRLGIFVNGQLMCIGTPKEITTRFASFLVYTITVPPEQLVDAKQMVESWSQSAVLTYELGGTLKYELPTSEVTLSQVFSAMNAAKDRGLAVIDWGVSNATLEEVFIKVGRAMAKHMTRLD